MGIGITSPILGVIRPGEVSVALNGKGKKTNVKKKSVMKDRRRGVWECESVGV
jgi:hypothetical protein